MRLVPMWRDHKTPGCSTWITLVTAGGLESHTVGRSGVTFLDALDEEKGLGKAYEKQNQVVTRQVTEPSSSAG